MFLPIYVPYFIRATILGLVAFIITDISYHFDISYHSSVQQLPLLFTSDL